MRNEIKKLLADALPAVDLTSDFLFAELDSLGIASILYILSNKYDIVLDAEDVTPRNFKDLDAIVAMVRSKRSMEGRIAQHAVNTPDKVAAVCGDTQMTYAELWAAITERAAALSAGGLQPHRPYVYRASQDIDFIITYCAVHSLKAIAVPLEHDAPEERFHAVEEEVNGSTYDDDIADILYTTGTTGKSKGVMISYTCQISCADNFMTDLRFTSDLCFIISGPFNHIATLFKLHPTLSAGATVCVINGLKDFNAFFKCFDLPFQKFATFLVPAHIRLLLQFSHDKLVSLADKIDFIETGAAPITRADMELLSKTLPHSHLYNTYGGTEIGCVASYDFNDGRYLEGCVGHTLKNATVEIEPDGTVIVSGQTIMSGYVNDEELTRSVIVDGKIVGADLGYFDEEGMIHLTGRRGDIINVGGYKINPLEVESVAAQMPEIKECVCAPTKHPVIGTVLKLYVVLAEGKELDKSAIAAYLKSKMEAYKVPTTYEAVPALQRTYNGKLDRKYYSTLKDE